MFIKFDHVSYTYSVNTPFQYHALQDINLEIKENSFTAIIGQTGSGKSTLVQHLNGLITPSLGRLCVGDIVIEAKQKNKKLKALRRKAGLVFQFPEYQLFEETVEKDIIFGPRNFGVSEAEAKQIAKTVIKAVGLDESYLERVPFDLSGGQKRRVAIAGILAMEPDILILDEPTAGLDPQGAKDMMEMFKMLQEQGKTIILVTHDMNHVLGYADQVVVMSEGTIKCIDSADYVFSNKALLDEVKIELPFIRQFINKLNQSKYHLDPAIKTIDALANAIEEQIK